MSLSHSSFASSSSHSSFSSLVFFSFLLLFVVFRGIEKKRRLFSLHREYIGEYMVYVCFWIFMCCSLPFFHFLFIRLNSMRLLTNQKKPVSWMLVCVCERESGGEIGTERESERKIGKTKRKYPQIHKEIVSGRE